LPGGREAQHRKLQTCGKTSCAKTNANFERKFRFGFPKAGSNCFNQRLPLSFSNQPSVW
jgi:hypothetical protein